MTPEQEGSWVCNECDSHEYTGSISADDIEEENLSCTSCGGTEFHWVEEKSMTPEPKKVYFELPKWAVLLDAETHEKVLEAPREYCRKVAAMENWEIVDAPKESQ